MTNHFHEEITELKKKLTAMSRLAEYAIENATNALLRQNPDFAELVFDKEKNINLMEIEVDEAAHRLLALAQPVAGDLRSITTVLKINSDLERIADHAVNIAESAKDLALEASWLKLDLGLSEMALSVKNVLKDAIEAFIQENPALAESVLRRDDEIDRAHHSICSKVENWISCKPENVPVGMKIVRISHNLERIGDLANNIAEDVVYMKQGREVRHHHLEKPPIDRGL